MYNIFTMNNNYHPQISAIFQAYNKARSAAKRGKLEWGRNNRGLGLAQSPVKFHKAIDKYHTTLRDCGCSDKFFNPTLVCKHQNALMIIVRASQIEGKNYRQELLITETSNCEAIVAEQFANYRYRIHIFESVDLANEFIAMHENNWVRVSDVKGTRVRPDTEHTWVEFDSPRTTETILSELGY